MDTSIADPTFVALNWMNYFHICVICIYGNPEFRHTVSGFAIASCCIVYLLVFVVCNYVVFFTYSSSLFFSPIFVNLCVNKEVQLRFAIIIICVKSFCTV